jgi:hypothetical protein
MQLTKKIFYFACQQKLKRFSMKRLNFFFTFVLFFVINISLFSQVPQITQHPLSFTKCINNSGILSVTATGPDLTYQWFKDNNPLLGETQNQLIFPSLQVSDEGEYFCRVTNPNGFVDSYIAQVLVAAEGPTINGISTEYDLICEGETNTFTADYLGQYVIGKWYRDYFQVGVGQQLNITNATQNHEGNYWFVAENACGTVTSSELYLEVAAPIQILTQPQTMHVCEGEDVTITVQVTGDYIGYIWLKNGEIMPAEQSNTIIIPNVTYPNNDNYKLVVYNLCNSDTTLAIYINVNTAPNIVGQPLNSSACVGNEVTLYAVATSTTEPSYQWYNTDTGLIPDATTTQLNVTYQPNDTTGYYCVISNICGTVTTDTATITTKMPPQITQQPVGTEVCTGENISLIVKAIGTEPMYFQWLFNNANVFGSNITGAQNNIISISSILQSQQGFYKCHVSNECGFTQSDEVFVAVNIPPVILEQPQDIEICEGGNISINLLATGTEPLSYEWRKTDTNEIFSTTAQLVFENAEPSVSGQYFCSVSNTCGQITTNTFDILVKQSVGITTQPQDVEVCLGDFFELSITASGTGPFDYLWYRNGSAVSSATSSVYTVTNAQVNQSGEYFCRVFNDCGYEDSDIAIVNIGTVPAITWNPVGFDLCELETLNLIMDAQGDNFSLQWYHNDIPIPGATDTVLNIPLVNLSNTGSYYCLAYNACATVSTDTVNIEIFPAPNVNLGNDIHLCSDGGSVTLSANGQFEHYNWNNGYSYQPSIEVSQTGTYILEVTGSNGCKNRDTIEVVYHPYHTIMFGGSDIIACGPYTLNAGSGAYSYSWNTGANTPTITVTQTGTYSITVTGDYFGCTSTENVFIEVREPVIINLGPDLTAKVDSFVNIGIAPDYAEYLWNTGFTGPMLSVYGSVYGVGTHTFWLTATGYNGCSGTDTIKVTFTPLSNIENIDRENIISVYPNPAKDFVNVKSEVTIENYYLYNILGELLNSETINNKDFIIKFTNFAHGQYIIIFIDTDGNYYLNKIVTEN